MGPAVIMQLNINILLLLETGTFFWRLVTNFNLYILFRIYATGKVLWYTDISSLTLSPQAVVFLQPG